MKRLVAKADGNHEIIDLTEEEIAERLAEKSVRYNAELVREARDTAQARLVSTDWTQIPNCGLTLQCVAEYTMYRSELRALRIAPVANPEWPVEPTKTWE